MSVNSKTKYKSKEIKKEKKRDKNFWPSMIILIIMVLSIAGFAVMSGGGQSTSPSGTPNEVPFQEFRDQNTGQVFWGAIKNGEQFIFLDLNGFEEDMLAKNIANKIKTLSYVDLYVDDNFTSSESIFLINKALTGIKVPVNNIYEYNCNSNTLILTHDESLVQGECMRFNVNEQEAYNRTEALVYHLVKE